MQLSISKFLEPFFPDENESVYLFGLDAKGCPDGLSQKPAQYQTSRRTLKENRDLQIELKQINETRGLYFTVNSGGTKAEQITRINAVFAEIDDLPLEMQNDVFDNCLYPPSIRVETLRSIHAYWLMTGGVTVEDFTRIQYGLINGLKSDPAIKNPNRLMRLPFFNHVSFDSGEYLYKTVKVHTFNADTRFTVSEMDDAFPYSELKQPAYKKVDFPQNDQESVMQELRWRIMQHSTYRKSGEWGNMQGICHSGKSKSALGLNLRTGKVHCFGGCEYKIILAAFGLEFPQKRQQTTPPKFIPRPPQKSKTYEFLKNHLEQQRSENDA